MDLKEVFAAICIVFVAITGVLWWVNSLGTAYGVDDAGETFNNTMTRVKLFNNITSIGGDVAQSAQSQEGPGESDQQENLITRSLRTFTLLDDFLGLVPDLFGDAATILRIPQAYSRVAGIFFGFVFAFTLALLFILGVQKFRS